MKKFIIAAGVVAAALWAWNWYRERQKRQDQIYLNQRVYDELSDRGLVASDVRQANQQPISQRSAGPLAGLDLWDWWDTFTNKPTRETVFLPKNDRVSAFDEITVTPKDGVYY